MKKLAQLRNSLVALTLAFTMLFAVAAPSALAQAVTTRLDGTVKDPTGAIVPGAKITLTDVGTKIARTTTSNADGFFVFTDVIAGYYSLTAEMEGFKKAVVQNIKVDVGIPTTVNVTLEVGQIVEVVTVEATEAQAVINSVNSELQTVVQQRQIVDLPLNGRNPIQLAGLQAGVAGNEGTRSAAVNGLRGSFTNLTWDGININDNYIRTDSFFAVAAPNVEGTSEFSITTQNAGPDAGLGVAQVKIVTPRGANAYHGSLFEFHRNDVLDANTFFNNATDLPKPKLIRNQFGYSIGGPVLKNKLFFYTYYEGTRERTDTSILRNVLSDSARQGMFTYRRRDNGQLQTVNLLTLGRVAADPKVQSLIGLTPRPNDATAGDGSNFSGFRFNSSDPKDGNLWGFRFDYELTARHRFEAIYSRFTFDAPNDTFNDIGEPFPGRPGVGQSSTRPRGSFAWHWNASSNLTNEFRFGFNNYKVAFVTGETFADGYRLGFPITTSPVQNALPQGRPVSVYEWMDNSSWVKGDHVFRFGGNVRHVLAKPFNDAGIIPLYNVGFNETTNPNPLTVNLFPGGITTNDFTNASNILGLLGGFISDSAQTFNATSRTSGFVKGAAQERELSYYTTGLYAGDSWRLKPNFSLNLGLRWEFISVPTERNGLALQPLGGVNDLLNPQATLDFFGRGTGRQFFNNDFNNFAPSISFSWDPFKSGKTSIRAGYSISYGIDSNLTTVENAFANNDGLSQTIANFDGTGTVSRNGIVPITAPTFKVPRTIGENVVLDPQAALFTIDRNLRTPYVQQWTLSVEREIFPDTAVEVRYVGNHAAKLHRGADLNQVKIKENGFLDDFLRAQRNLQATGNPTRGEALQVFPRLGLGGLLTDPTVLTLLRNGEVGELAAIYVVFRDFFLTPGEFGARLDPSFFLRNPNTFVADYIGNLSSANYHGLQTEIRRRLKSGVYFQANYTFSKVFTDFEGNQANFAGLLDNASGRAVEKKRAAFDVSHVFNANWIYELPFGPGKRFLKQSGLVGKLIGGWQLGGIWQVRSGRPISIVSGRGTLNRAGRSLNKNTAISTLSVDQLQEKVGLFRDSQGRPVIFDPSLIGADGRANAQFFQNPGAGQLGTLQLTPVSGPRFFNMDINLSKTTQITERWGLEFRAEFFNVWNNVNFFIAENQNINAPTFGRVTDTFDPRILQFALKLKF
jgi:hypothetical protein